MPRTTGTWPTSICAGTDPISLRFLSPPDPNGDWYQFVGLASSILTNVSVSVIRQGARACVVSSEDSGQHFAKLQLSGARFECHTASLSRRVDLTVAK